MAIGFNEDLITEIFLRLPVKSILRFRTVSKRWLSIASSRRFRQIHACRIVNPTGLFFKGSFALSKEFEFLPFSSQISPNTFPPFDLPKKINLVSSSGGLVLFQSTSYHSFNLQLRNVRDYFVCNPTTKEFKHLDLSVGPQLISDSNLVCETLAFDPCKSPHYKIVFLCKYHRSIEHKFQMVIYSSETETFSSPRTTILFKFLFCGIYCNDAIHWISKNKKRCSFYYFDLKTERMKRSRFPPNLYELANYFGESRGHLHVVTLHADEYHSRLDVHELKSDYSGWSVKYQINLDFLAITIFPDLFSVFSVFVDEEEEKVVMVFLVRDKFVEHTFNRKLQLQLHTVLQEEKRFWNISYNYRNRGRMYGWPVAHHYMETLACV